VTRVGEFFILFFYGKNQVFYKTNLLRLLALDKTDSLRRIHFILT
ncbi:hypothetical protein LEP1GSC065_0265, partial [Leptospira kirschneri serovar Sokoine str. RM1]